MTPGWVDAATHLVARTLSTRTLRGHAVVLETDFADYRETGGVAFARSIELGVRGRPRRLHIVVESVETNIPLDEARFRMPDCAGNGPMGRTPDHRPGSGRTDKGQRTKDKRQRKTEKRALGGS